MSQFYFKAVYELTNGMATTGPSAGPIEKIQFLENATLPTEAEIQAKIAELQADHDSKQYQRDRAVAYPSWQDQLDKIFHDGIDAWKTDIQAIKDRFPKP